MKVVLDTNVWVSSLLLPYSIPGKIVSAWRQAQFITITSAPILEEIKKVVNYPKIQKRLSVSSEEIEEYLLFIRFFSEYHEVETHIPASNINLRDCNDVPILNTLLKSQADYLITGDQDLLTIRNHHPIITPAEFLNILE